MASPGATGRHHSARPSAPHRDPAIDVLLQHMFACPKDEAETIARRSSDRRYAMRAVIIKQGDRPDAAFLLLLGRAEAHAYGVAGRVVLVHEFRPGDVFGAIGGSDDAASQADVVAVDDVRAAVFAAKDFLSLVETHGCVAILVSRALLRQLRAAAARVRDQTTLSASGRIHAELLRLAGEKGGNIIDPAPMFSALALRVNSTRETVSRAVSALERRGIVRREGHALVIVAPHRLQELVV
jgi:CRP-like cAMP-binding protein